MIEVVVESFDSVFMYNLLLVVFVRNNTISVAYIFDPEWSPK